MKQPRGEPTNDCPGCIVANHVVALRGFSPIAYRAATQPMRDESGAEIDVCTTHVPFFGKRPKAT